MDPTSFTKTSFCGVEIDNITENDTKQYILDQLSVLCSGVQYKTRYAKVYNEQYSRNLKNPHVVCLKSSGTPYFMFLSQIGDTNYCFLIDKKIKEGYHYPKIFILPFQFDQEFYKGSLYECELLRDRENHWSILVGDSYYHKGKNQKNVIVMERMNTIHRGFETGIHYTPFLQTCPVIIKKYFDYKDVENILSEFVPKLSYDIRGLYFVPLKCSYSKILYLFPRNHQRNTNIPKRDVKTRQKSNSSINSNTQASSSPSTSPTTSYTKENQRVFRIMKTLKPDVYELYGMKNEDLNKVGVALVQSISDSRMLCEVFKNRDTISEVRVQCEYVSRFQKWKPIQVSEECISQI